MSRFPLLLASVFVCLSLTAQPIRVTAPQPISVMRTGIPYDSVVDPMVASNGTSFLVAWLDDRFETQSMNNQAYSSGLLMRVDAAGNSLDESPIAVPFAPKGVVWTGSEWITAGFYALARISAEGKIIEVQQIDQPGFGIHGLAWTGSRLVAIGTTSNQSGATGVRAVTFNEELDVVAFQQLTDAPSRILATAGDGQSAIALWRGTMESSPGESLHAATFGSDGLVQEIRTNLVTDLLGWPYTYELPVGATGQGYVVLYPGSNPFNMYKGLWVEQDLDTRPIFIPPQYQLRGEASMTWNGTSLTLYSSDLERRLLATRFSRDGYLASTPQVFGTVDTVFWPRLAAASVGASAIVAYADHPSNDHPAIELKFRVIGTPGVPHFDRSLDSAGALPQDLPDSVSTATQSLVAWRERTSPTTWAVHATRLDGTARVLDPESMLLAESSCDKVRPTVATDGENYLAAWHDKNGIGLAAIRADGTFTKRSFSLRYGAPCAEAPLRLLSNGTDYLLLWFEKPTKTSKDWTLFARRLGADGSPLEVQPITAGTMTAEYPSQLRFSAASNGRDYLIAWERAALRLTSEGAILDTFQKIPLGMGYVQSIWWNGTTYVVETQYNANYWFLRIGSDGTGGRPPFGPQGDSVAIPGGSGYFYRGLQAVAPCDSSGCWVAGTTRHADGTDRPAVLRFEDDGTTITIRRHEVANLSYASPSDWSPIPASIVNAERPAFLFLPQRMEQPFSSTHRLMIAPFAVPRARAAHH